MKKKIPIECAKFDVLSDSKFSKLNFYHLLQIDFHYSKVEKLKCILIKSLSLVACIIFCQVFFSSTFPCNFQCCHYNL